MNTIINLKEVEITLARPSHVEQLQTLFKQLVPDWSPEKSRMEEALKSLDPTINRIFVATYNQEVIGSAELIIYENLIRVPFKKAMVDSVIVLEEFRNQGVGTKLIKQILVEAGNEKVTKLYLFSAFNREKSFPFYERMGFKENGLSFNFDF